MSTNTRTPATALSRSTRWGYGGGEWANAVVWTAFTSLFLYFLTDTVGIGPAIGGLIVAIGTLWNTVLQPVVGVLSDRTRSAMGRRRPFLLYCIVPFAVLSWALFTDFGLTGNGAALYFGVVVVLWFTVLTLFYVPYSALGAELSSDSHERTRLSSVRTAFSQVGALVGATLPLFLLDPLTQLTGSGSVAWSIASAILGVLAGIGIFATWRTSRRHTVMTAPAAMTIRDMLGVFKLRTFRYLMAAYVFGWAPLSLIGTVSIYYSVHVMGFTETEASLVLLVWFAAGLAWLPLVQFLSKRIGKVRTYLVFTIGWAIAQALFFVTDRGSDVLFWLVLIASSAGSMAVAVVGWSLLADVTDVEELRSGRRREGAMYGVAALAQTGFAAILIWLVGVTLAIGGYQGGSAVGPDALLAIRILMAFGTGICLIPGIIFASRIRLTTARHDRIRAALDSDVPLAQEAREELLRDL
ncbi:MAG: MFS transporter [Pseudolysinimonas sp.]